MQAPEITQQQFIQATGLNPADPMIGPLVRKGTEEANREWQRRMQYVSPAGKLNLPPLLDARRLEHAIPDAVFNVAGLFERIALWTEIPMLGVVDGMASKHIHLPEAKYSEEKLRSPRCVLVGGGIRALDILHANGTELGHIVYILHLNPWWIPVGKSSEGHEWYVRVCAVGDLCGNEDLARELREKRVEYVEDEEDGLLRVKRDGKLLAPIAPGMREDY